MTQLIRLSFISDKLHAYHRIKLFNLCYTLLSNVVKCFYGIWKRLFKIHQLVLDVNISTQVRLVYDTVAQHNFITIMEGDNDDEELVKEEVFKSSQEKKSHT